MTRLLGPTLGPVLRSVSRRLRDERGVGERGAAIIEFCYLGILFLVPIVYIMITVFDVQRAAYATTAAAREASRAYTLGSSPGDATSRARAAFESAMSDQGIPPSDADLNVVCDPGPCLAPGSMAVATVQYNVKIPGAPVALGGRDAFTIPTTSTHTTPYGEFRESAG
jgi:hypothetical protein